MSDVRAILDASALIAWLNDERGAATIERLLPVCGIVAVNLAEAYERTDTRDPADLDEVADDLSALGLTLLPFETDDAKYVPLIREEGRRTATRGEEAMVIPDGLSLGDCCCLAAAMRRDLPVITDDTAWQTLGLGLTVHLYK